MPGLNAQLEVTVNAPEPPRRVEGPRSFNVGPEGFRV